MSRWGDRGKVKCTDCPFAGEMTEATEGTLATVKCGHPKRPTVEMVYVADWSHYCWWRFKSD